MMREIAFQNKSKSKALDISNRQASRLATFDRHAPIEDLLYAPYALCEWRPDYIESYLDLITPSNCVYILTTLENGKLPDLKTELHYGAKFTSTKLDENYIHCLKSATPGLNQSLKHCPPN